MICKHCGGEIILSFENISTGQIIDSVCKEFGITREQIEQKVRFRNITIPRHICYYLLHKNKSLSLGQIGQIFNQHHTTVLHSIEVVKDLMFSSKEIRGKVEYLENAIGKLVN